MEKKTFDHSKASIQDQIAFISELEHGRFHCIRSAKVAENQKEKFVYSVHAKQFQDLRREAMAKFFPDLSELDWCLVKVAARLKQLSYELFEGDLEYLTKIENLTDNIIGHALRSDLTGCQACKSDMEAIKKADSSEEESA